MSAGSRRCSRRVVEPERSDSGNLRTSGRACFLERSRGSCWWRAPTAVLVVFRRRPSTCWRTWAPAKRRRNAACRRRATEPPRSGPGSGRLPRSSVARARGVTPEEAVLLPRRPARVVGDRDGQWANSPLVFRLSYQVDRLVHVVGGGVVSISPPVLHDLILRRPGDVPHVDHHRRNALANKVVLIAADEDVAQRRGISLHT